MAHFLGVLSGSRGDATRCGTKNSGMTARVMSWSGCVEIDVCHSEETDKNYFTIYQKQHPGNGAGTREEIASGIIGQPTKKENGNGELIEALELAEATIERVALRHGSPVSNSVGGTLDVIRAAIKKAKG